MEKVILILLFLFVIVFSLPAQVEQIRRYEMEKKNTDDFCTVATVGDLGVVIFRDFAKEFSFGNKVDGDEWEITMLDTNLEEMWQKTYAIDYKFLFKAYNISNGKLYMLFREGEFEKSDYQLLEINLRSGDISRHTIENEIALDLSHITMVDDLVVIAGYVRYSPTVVSYRIGDETLEVIPGFFKDRSHVIDLKNNENGTFSILTLEKDYENYFLRLRTYSKKGAILFERQIDMHEDYRVLSGKVTDFIDGNIAISGSYGGKNSYFSQGIYFAIAKPEGQANILKYIDFTEMEHFFDYMGERRSARIKRKIERKNKAGKEYKYRTRLLLHEIKKSHDGFLVTAEIYDPRYENRFNRNNTFNSSYLNPGFNDSYQNANYQYVKQPSRLVNVDDANHFEYLESVALKLNKKGDLLWDQSFKIDDVESASLAPVVDIAVTNDEIMMLYRSEEQVSYKRVTDSDSTMQDVQPIKLEYEKDEIKHNYNLIGGTQYWYDTNFIVWGYHKIGNKDNPNVENRRNVLFINKVRFE